MKGIAAVVVIVLAAMVLGVLGAPTAQGSPASPTAFISTNLVPTAAQTIQVTLSTQVYSVLAPTVTFLYSATQTATGGSVSLASNVVVTGNVIQSNVNGTAFLSTVAATVTFTTSALCATCTGSPVNLTLTVQAIAHAGAYSIFQRTWTSPITTIVFSSTAAYKSVPAVGASSGSAPSTTFYGEFAGSLLLLIAVVLIAFAFLIRTPTVFVSLLTAGVIVLMGGLYLVLMWA
jgi:hypothetical protein